MAELLKNIYTTTYISSLAEKIKEHYSSFESEKFITSVFDETWKSLELKNRMRHIALKLHAFLPLSYEHQLEILKPVSNDFVSYEAMFFQDFVEVFGLDNFVVSMQALGVFTIDSSSEFAIRKFILKYEEKTMQQMHIWAKSKNEHLRRLASEGCRPRLPWAIALPKYKKNPTEVLKILEVLKNDNSKYVQKSVANNLNDISKDNPNVVIKFVKENLGKSISLDWICKHASRTLLKQGNPTVLSLFGFCDVSHVNIINFKYDKLVNIQGDFHFSFDLRSEKKLGNLRIEYAIYYKKANGHHAKKVFMISQSDIKQTLKSIIKKQSFRNLTTRKHYSGEHFIVLILNGIEKEKRSFILNDTSN